MNAMTAFTTRGIVRLADVEPMDLTRVGPKAFRLGMMLRSGLPVPEGFCLSAAVRAHFLIETGLQPLD